MSDCLVIQRKHARIYGRGNANSTKYKYYIVVLFMSIIETNIGKQN